MFGKRNPGFRNVGTELVETLRRSARIIDVREPDEYAQDHLPEAELVPLGTLARAAANWDRSAAYLLVCRSGGRSRRGAAELVSLGFTNVMNLDGGMTALRRSDRP